MFYYTLGNLKPRLRADLKAIQLIAVVKHTHLKEYGLASVLKPFIDDMNILSKVCTYVAAYIVQVHACIFANIYIHNCIYVTALLYRDTFWH